MERLIDLENRHLRLLCELLSTYLTDKTVWAYGSRVKWKASPTSDLDLVVWGATDLEVDNAKDAFVESDLPFTVQLLIWEDIPENFKENIRKKYVVLQEKPVRKGWREVRLGEVCEVFGGGTPSTKVPEYWDGDIPWLTPKDLSNLSERYISKGERSISDLGLARSSAKLLPEGAILLTTRAPIGYLAIAKNEISTNQGFRSLIAKKTNNLFLFYLLKQNVDYLKSQSSGTTFGELAGSTLKSLSFLFPPLPEQKAIAEILSSLDDKIDLLHRQNKTLENIAQTLFRQWFVEEVDEEWVKEKISDLVEILSGFAFKSSSFVENGVYQVITIKNVQDGYLDPSITNKIARIPSNTPSYCLLKQGDILLSLTGHVGRCCLTSGKNLLLNQRVAKVRAKEGRDWAFSYIFFRQSRMKKIMEDIAKGTAQPNLSPVETANIAINIPPSNTLQKFSEISSPLLDKILKNKSQIHTLENLRDTLLPKLMRGKVKLKC